MQRGEEIHWARATSTALSLEKTIFFLLLTTGGTFEAYASAAFFFSSSSLFAFTSSSSSSSCSESSAVTLLTLGLSSPVVDYAIHAEIRVPNPGCKKLRMQSVRAVQNPLMGARDSTQHHGSSISFLSSLRSISFVFLTEPFVGSFSMAISVSATISKTEGAFEKTYSLGFPTSFQTLRTTSF